jgi:hypothetical protein
MDRWAFQDCHFYALSSKLLFYIAFYMRDGIAPFQYEVTLVIEKNIYMNLKIDIYI